LRGGLFVFLPRKRILLLKEKETSPFALKGYSPSSMIGSLISSSCFLFGNADPSPPPIPGKRESFFPFRKRLVSSFSFLSVPLSRRERGLSLFFWAFAFLLPQTFLFLLQRSVKPSLPTREEAPPVPFFFFSGF